MAKQRVISLLPSCTEIVHALGCGDQLVGRSHECDFPPEVSGLPACTSTKIDPNATSADIDREVKVRLRNALSLYEVDWEKIKELRPDLILSQSQCEVCAVSESDLQEFLAREFLHPPRVVSLAPKCFADLWSDMGKLAAALGCEANAKEAIRAYKDRVVNIIEKTAPLKNRPNVACIEWIEPLMAAGNWMPEMVELAGGKNLFGEAGRHSPWMEWEALAKRDPAMLIFLPCGFTIARTRNELAPFLQRPEWKRLRAVSSGQVFLTDGHQYFNRPGPRLVDSLEILAEIIQPKLFSFGYEGKGWERL